MSGGPSVPSAVRKRSLVLIAISCAIGIGAIVGIGYAIGSSATPNDDELRSERRDGYAEALRASKSRAFRRARQRGVSAGLRAGRREGRRIGERRGKSEGSSDAEAELALIAQEEAEAAAQEEAEERAANCGAPYFVPGYCPTDEEIEREGLAESLCGPGEPALEQEAAEQGIQCRRR